MARDLPIASAAGKRLFDEWRVSAQPAGKRSRASRPPRSSLSSRVMRAAVDFGDVADDGEAEPGALLAGGVEPRAARENVGRAGPAAMPGPSSSIRISAKPSAGGLDRHEHAAAAIFGGILDEVAEHFVEVLALDADLDGLVAGEVDGDLVVERVDRALDRLGAVPHR